MSAASPGRTCKRRRGRNDGGGLGERLRSGSVGQGGSLSVHEPSPRGSGRQDPLASPRDSGRPLSVRLGQTHDVFPDVIEDHLIIDRPNLH